MGNGSSTMSTEDKNVRSFNGHASHMNSSKLKTKKVSYRPAYSDEQQSQGTGSSITKSVTSGGVKPVCGGLPCPENISDSDTNSLIFTSDCWDSDQSSCGYPALANLSSNASSSTLSRTHVTHRNIVNNRKRFDLITNNSTSTWSLDSTRSQTPTTNCSEDESSCNIGPPNRKSILRRNKDSTKSTMKPGQKAFIKFVPELKKRPHTAPGFVDLSIKQKQATTSTDSVSINSSNKSELLCSSVASNEKPVDVKIVDTNVVNRTVYINAKIDASSQTKHTESVGIQCNLLDKGCFLPDAILDVNGFGREKILDFAIEAVSRSQHLDKLRTFSAQSPRRQLSQTSFVNQRCKSAYAILLTQTQMSSESIANCHTTLTSTRVEIESTKVISSDSESSALLSSDESPEAFSTQMNRAKSQIIARRPYTSLPRPMSLPAVRNRSGHSKMLRQSSGTKMNELFKTYGRNCYSHGLNISPKKMRLPLHCGYKAMTAEEISDIVERLSSSRISSRRIHECYGCANATERKCKTCRTKKHCQSLLNETLYQVNHLSSCTASKRKGWRKYKQDNRQPIQVENMMTESLRQINSSLQEANKALTSLNSIMDAVSSCSGDNGFTNKNSKMITPTQETHRSYDKLPKNKYFVTQQRKSACCMKMKQCSCDITRTKPCPVQGQKLNLVHGRKRYQLSLMTARTNSVANKPRAVPITKNSNSTKKKTLERETLNCSRE